MDLKQKLSANYELWEFVVSQTAERKGINNIPSEEVVRNLKKLCDTILQPARFDLGPLMVSSGYRAPKLNKAVGGASDSGHILGFCADILPINVSKLDFARWVYKNANFDQIILEYGSKDEPAWVHVSADPRGRRQVLQILKGSKYEHINLK